MPYPCEHVYTLDRLLNHSHVGVMRQGVLCGPGARDFDLPETLSLLDSGVIPMVFEHSGAATSNHGGSCGSLNRTGRNHARRVNRTRIIGRGRRDSRYRAAPSGTPSWQWRSDPRPGTLSLRSPPVRPHCFVDIGEYRGIKTHKGGLPYNLLKP